MTRASDRPAPVGVRAVAFAVAVFAVFLGASLACYAIGMRGSSFALVQGIVALERSFGIVPGLLTAFLLLAASTAAIASKAPTIAFIARAVEAAMAGFLVAVLLGTLGSHEGGAVGRMMGERFAQTISQPIAAALCGVTAFLAVWLAIEGNLRDLGSLSRGDEFDDEPAAVAVHERPALLETIGGWFRRAPVEAVAFAPASTSRFAPEAAARLEPEPFGAPASSGGVAVADDEVSDATNEEIEARITAEIEAEAEIRAEHEESVSAPIAVVPRAEAPVAVAEPVAERPAVPAVDEEVGDPVPFRLEPTPETAEESLPLPSIGVVAPREGASPTSQEEHEIAEAVERVDSFARDPGAAPDEGAGLAGGSVDRILDGAERVDGDEPSPQVGIAEARVERAELEEAPAVALIETDELPRTIPRAPSERHGGVLLAPVVEAPAEEPIVFAVETATEVIDVVESVEAVEVVPDVAVEPAEPEESVADSEPAEAAEPAAADGTVSEELDRAARLVMGEGRASISFLQRKLGVSFGDAQRLVAELEHAGVVGPYRGTPSRDILLTLSDWEGRAAS